MVPKNELHHIWYLSSQYVFLKFIYIIIEVLKLLKLLTSKMICKDYMYMYVHYTESCILCSEKKVVIV